MRHLASKAVRGPIFSGPGSLSATSESPGRDGSAQWRGGSVISDTSGPAKTALVLTAAAVLGLGSADLVQHYRLALAGSIALSAARAVPLVVGRRRPFWACWLSLGTVLLTAAFARPVSSSEPWPWAVTSVLSHGAVLLVLAASGARAKLLLVAWVAALGSGSALLAVAPHRGQWEGLVVVAFVFGIALVAGDAVGGRREAARRLVAEAAVTRTERSQRVLLEERARIARDLHDVVGHHMSLVVVQAESAPLRLGEMSEVVADEFRQIARVARGSLEESRRLLAVLRHDPGDRDPLHPQPSLWDLAELVEQTSRAGTAAELVVDGGEDQLPAGIELVVYRLVQEGLSNVVRHAPGAAARVEVVRRADALNVSIVSGSGSLDRAAPPSAGQGLIGMRERVALVEGSLEAGPTATGGWRVAAVIPLPAALPGQRRS